MRLTAQEVAVHALLAALGGVRVSTSMPDPRPAEHVIVSRIGNVDPPFGARVPRFLVECYAPSELEAERLGEWVHEVWKTLRTHGINWSSTDDNLVPYDAPDEKHHRFQFTGSLQILL